MLASDPNHFPGLEAFSLLGMEKGPGCTLT